MDATDKLSDVKVVVISPQLTQTQSTRQRLKWPAQTNCKLGNADLKLAQALNNGSAISLRPINVVCGNCGAPHLKAEVTLEHSNALDDFPDRISNAFP